MRFKTCGSRESAPGYMLCTALVLGLCSVSAAADDEPPPLLPAPEVVGASAGTYTNRICVEWSEVTGATNYVVRRHTVFETRDMEIIFHTTNAFYNDYDIIPGTDYSYRVQGQDTNGPGHASGMVTGYGRISSPIAVMAGTGTVAQGLTVAWDPVAHAVRYEIWRHDSGAPTNTAVLLDEVTENIYVDRNVRPAAYNYRLRSVGANGLAGDFSLPAAGRCLAAAVNDFDGDGRADAALYDPVDGIWRVFLSGGQYTQQVWEAGGPGFVALSGDYDGDGLADPAVYHPDRGLWIILLSSQDYQPHTLELGGPDHYPLTGDYDGDGLTDPAVYHPASGAWLVKLSASDYQEYVLYYGGPGWQPVPGDYDGDGLTDPAVYHAMQGHWTVLSSARAYAELSAEFGGPWQRPVPGDYDGDGLTDPAVYHVQSGTWQVMLSDSGYGVAGLDYGGPGWQPVPADYDGDGRADPVVRHVATGDWRGLFSGSNYAEFGGELGAAGAGWRPLLPGYRPVYKFLAFGDSITYGAGSSAQGPATGYPMLLERLLNTNYGGGFVSVNVGISGEETSQGLARFAVVLETHVPALVLLMEGTNDLGADRDFNRIENNLRAMIDMAQARGIAVVLATIPPVISNRYRDRSEQQARIVRFNPRIYGIAADYGIPVARVYEAITAVPGWQSALMEQETANHPNDAGYLYVRDAFYEVVTAALEAGRYY